VQRNPDGSVPIPCGSPPNRPTDPGARTNLIDEEQGIVISFGNVNGVVAPYLVTDPTLSAFVPTSMLGSYDELLRQQRASGRFTKPALKRMPATVTVAQMYRIFDGKLQGMHLLEHLGPPGAVSSWNAATK
jgi:hypothetical protein